jgi:hypothetical protein
MCSPLRAGSYPDRLASSSSSRAAAHASPATDAQRCHGLLTIVPYASTRTRSDQSVTSGSPLPAVHARPDFLKVAALVAASVAPKKEGSRLRRRWVASAPGCRDQEPILCWIRAWSVCSLGRLDACSGPAENCECVTGGGLPWGSQVNPDLETGFRPPATRRGRP